MRRQTSLRPSEGGKFAKPIGQKVKETDGDYVANREVREPRAVACALRKSPGVDWSDVAREPRSEAGTGPRCDRCGYVAICFDDAFCVRCGTPYAPLGETFPQFKERVDAEPKRERSGQMLVVDAELERERARLVDKRVQYRGWGEGRGNISAWAGAVKRVIRDKDTVYAEFAESEQALAKCADLEPIPDARLTFADLKVGERFTFAEQKYAARVWTKGKYDGCCNCMTDDRCLGVAHDHNAVVRA